MPEPSERRAEELEQLLQDQPGSRLFVQLAEEYRRLERYDDAVRTLEKGLEDQPTYVSARVLLGRCLLESGDAERAVPELEQVLRQDQTHLLAHKLLAEAHLGAGDWEAARRRLEQYEMLNESDPEIAQLRARLPEAAEEEAPPPAADAEADAPLKEPRGAPPPSPAAEPEGADELFDLGSPGPAARPPEDEDLLGVWEEPEPAAEPPSEAARAEEPGAPETDPFGELWTEEDQHRLERGFVEEGLFTPQPAAERAEPEGPVPAPQAVEAPEAPQVATAPEEKEATVTLGRLYLQQGHLGEARRIFRRVLEREPGNQAARAELLRLESADVEGAEPAAAPEAAEELGRVGLTAADLEDPGARNLGLSERKARMLAQYLRQIRRVAERHVR